MWRKTTWISSASSSRALCEAFLSASRSPDRCSWADWALTRWLGSHLFSCKYRLQTSVPLSVPLPTLVAMLDAAYPLEPSHLVSLSQCAGEARPRPRVIASKLIV
jgi:hypothetical protein